MTETIKFELDGDGIATLTIELPEATMNVVNRAFLSDLSELVKKVTEDEAIKGAVIISAKPSFMAGADLRMLAQMSKEAEGMSPEERFKVAFGYSDLLRQLETNGKPFVAAVHGLALGGGLELALACHYRVLSDDRSTKLGLPEVLVGLLPGAGGMQRLSRLAGLQVALQYASTGKNLSSMEAVALKVADLVVPKDKLLESAKAWLLDKPVAQQPWDKRGFKIPGGGGAMHPNAVRTMIGASAMAQDKSWHNYPAVEAILSSIYEGAIVPFDTAIRLDSKRFADLMAGPVAPNMIRTLFINKLAAERGAKRPEGQEKKPIGKLGLLGAGMMGAGIAYVTFDAHRDGDFEPYIFRTTDFGETWTSLAAGLPSGSVNSMAEHPENPNALFVGTEHGLFVSTSTGTDWAKLSHLPTTHVDDLILHPREKDLVIGTHGQSIWILDDTTPLAEWTAEVASAAAHVFSIQGTTIFNYRKDTSYRGQAEFHGTNPVDGALITYALGPGGGAATLRITNASGRLVQELIVPSDPGIHRVNWDLRHGALDGPQIWIRHDDSRLARPIDTKGPWVSPGTFTVTLEARAATSTQTVEVRGDPLLSITQAMYEEREAFLLELLALEERIDEARPDLRCGPSADPRGNEADLCRIQRQARALRQALGGQEVRPGSLHPPTPEHIRRKSAIEDRLDRILPSTRDDH